LLNVKASIKKLAVFSGFVLSLAAHAESITQLKSIDFGTIVPTIGSCTMDPTTGTITSPGNICLSSGNLGRYTIYGTASTTIEIRFVAGTDATNGLTFYPTARFTNNVGDDTTNLITGSITNFNTGTDGRIDIYVGGIIDLSQSISASSQYTFDWDIEYTEL
jgi:hypothetical protein